MGIDTVDGRTMLMTKKAPIRTWRRFARRVRSRGCTLLREIDKFPNAVLVSGCQRSGTTILARTIFQSQGMVDYWRGKDDELDAALILSGAVEHAAGAGRYCFQTTYLNECYPEYFEHRDGFRLIWVLRNPFSVIHSMLYNWGRFAFNELFASCGAPLLEADEALRYRRFGVLGISRLRRACLAYNGKTQQLFELKARLRSERVFVVDYDDLVQDKVAVLPQIFKFIEHPYEASYNERFNARSISKSALLSQRQMDVISGTCMSTYDRAREQLSIAKSDRSPRTGPQR